MKIVFRADASLVIGTGHVMRCLALADVLRARGAECVFLARAHEGHLQAFVEARGFQSLLLGGPDTFLAPPPGSDYRQWVGAAPLQDAVETLAQLGHTPVDWIVVDHYGLDAEWEQAVRPACRRLLAIDDLANRTHSVDLLLDQNLGKTPAAYENLMLSPAICLTGPQFALLRPEFAMARAGGLTRRVGGQIKNILVSMGGVDLENATAAVLTGLAAKEYCEDLTVNVVLGGGAPGRESVRKLAGSMPFPTEVLIDVRNMAQLMRDADIAIGAAGSTSWERCCLGLPAIQLVLADNQRLIAQTLCDAGAARLIERACLADELPQVMAEFERDHTLLPRMSEAAARVTDGQGTERVAQQMMEGLAT